MLDKQTRTLIAQRLNQAEKQREQIRAISLDYPSITIEDAYAVQREWVEMKIAEGRVLKGHKIGLTSKAMQASSQISEPDYGALLDDMFFHDGSDIPTDRFIVPRIEVELAFVLAKPLRGPNCTLFDVYNATDYVIPALELIDARCHNIDPETQRPRKVFDTISDNAANAGVILGGRPIKPDELDLRWISALLYRNGVIEETGAAIKEQRVVGPARVIRHLTRRRAGQLVRFTFDEVIKRVFHVNVRAVGRLRWRRDIIPAWAHDRRRHARGLHLRRRNGRRSRAYRSFLQRAGWLSTHLKTQLRGVRTAKIIEESIDIIEVFVPYPVEHKTVWRIQCQRVIAQFRLQWADPHAEFCGW